MDAYTERLELPDGQYGVFHTRIGYAGDLLIRRATALEGTIVIFEDAILRAFLDHAMLKDFESGELVRMEPTNLARANTEAVDALITKAAALYIEWKKQANPKATAETAPESEEPESSKS
jgi:hypothetical protein